MRNQRWIYYTIFAIAALVLATALVYEYYSTDSIQKIEAAPNFIATDHLNRTFELNEFRGNITILHITQLENPLCMECERHMIDQIRELEKLAALNKSNLQIVTLNIRKNQYSEDGWKMAAAYYGVNVSWHWVEEFGPYNAVAPYDKYWNVKGAFANPTIILINPDLKVVGAYHIYCIGAGEIDGVQDAGALSGKIEQIEKGEWGEFEGEAFQQGVSFLGMFALGVITSLAPCSITLLVAMFSYIMISAGKEGKKGRADSSYSKEGFVIGVGFTLGMGLVFLIIGIFISAVGAFIRASPFFYLVAGVLMLIFGINNIKSIGEMFGSIRNVFNMRNRPENIEAIKEKEGTKERKSVMERVSGLSVALFRHSVFIGAFVLGIFFALGWAPCAISLISPVLIGMVTQDISVFMGAMLLFVFGLGHGIPIIPIAMISKTARGRIAQKYISVGKWVTKIFGIAVMILGIVFAARFFGYCLW